MSDSASPTPVEAAAVPAPAVPAPTPAPAVAPAKSKGPSLAQLLVIVGILGGGVLLTLFTADVDKVSEPGVVMAEGAPFLVDRFGTWQGGAMEGLTQTEKDVLPKDTTGARRLYKDADGNEVFCSIVLAGKDVTSIHRPEMCLPGQGWVIQSEFVETLPVAGAPGGKLQVMRMNTVRPVRLPDGRTAQAQSIFTYWFVGKDKITPHHWQRIMWTTMDRVFHNTNHRWAYVLIHAPVTAGMAGPGTGRSAEDTMRVVGRFVGDLYPSLVPRS